MPSFEIVIREDADAVSTEAAARFVRIAGEAIKGNGQFRVALSGGSTPRRLFEKLASDEWRDKVDWNHVHLFWSDERAVAPDDKDSNFRTARESLIKFIHVPPANIHRMEGERAQAGEANAANAAADYEAVLRRVFGASENEIPRFDLILLGMGADGHTASLFPQTSALDERTRLVADVWVASLQTRRLTFTTPLINHAACVMFLVVGADKSGRLREILQPVNDEVIYPSQLVRPTNGELVWLIDEAAASELDERRTRAANRSELN